MTGTESLMEARPPQGQCPATWLDTTTRCALPSGHSGDHSLVDHSPNRLVEVAALFVETGGTYFGLEGVDPWDEERDARLYCGPHPVVAHPPCKTWSTMSQCRPEIVRGEDGGCFKAALAAVRRFGGVLEHPANTHAWRRYGLPRPAAVGWGGYIIGPGWTCEIDQAQYGHPANKRTWLYYVGDTEPPDMRWGPAPFTGRTVRNDGGGGRDQRSKTPPEFRDVLIAMARASRITSEVVT